MMFFFKQMNIIGIDYSGIKPMYVPKFTRQIKCC